MNDKKRLFLNSAAVFFATVLDNAVFFIVNIIIARYLSLEHFGEYTTALGYATFFTTFTDIGINGTLQRMISKDPSRERQHFGNTIALKTVFSVGAFALMALSLPFTNYSHSTVCLTLIMGMFRIGNEYHQTFTALFDVKERFFLSSALRSTFCVSFLCATVCVVLLRGDYFDLAWARFAVVAAFIVILFFASFRIVMPSIKKETMRDFFLHSIPFGASSIMLIFYQRFNIILLSLMHGSIQSGIFSNGYMFFSTLFFIPANAVRVLLPYLYRADPKRDREKFQFAFNFYSKVLLIGGFWITLVIVICAQPIIRIIFGSKYDASIPVLQISALGIPFVFSVGSTIITSVDRQRVLTRIQLAGLAVNIAASFLMIRFWVSEGAAAASVLTYGFVNIAGIVYLSAAGVVSSRFYWLCFAELTAVSAGVWMLMTRLLPDLPLVPSALITSVLFLVPVAALMLRRNDLRIVREMLGKTT